MTARTLSLVTSPPKTPLRRGAPIFSRTSLPKWQVDEVGYALVLLGGGGSELVCAGYFGVKGLFSFEAEEFGGVESGEVGGTIMRIPSGMAWRRPSMRT